MRCLLPQIAFLSNVEIRYCVLGRGGAQQCECLPILGINRNGVEPGWRKLAGGLQKYSAASARALLCAITLLPLPHVRG